MRKIHVPKYPVKLAHVMVYCCECGRSLKDSPHLLNGHTHGDGAWRKLCLKCRLWTCYDIVSDISNYYKKKSTRSGKTI